MAANLWEHYSSYSLFCAGLLRWEEQERGRRADASGKLNTILHYAFGRPRCTEYRLRGRQRSKLEFRSEGGSMAANASGSILYLITAWVQVWVQLKKGKWLPISRKRHQIGRLDFRSFRLLTEGLLVRI